MIPCWFFFFYVCTRIHTFRSCSVHIRQSQSVLLNFCIWHPKLLVIIALRVVGQRHAQNSLFFFFSLLRNVFYWKRKFNSSTEPNKSKPNRFNCITRNFVVAIVWNWMRTCAPRWLVFAAFFGLFCRFAFIFMKYEISLRVVTHAHESRIKLNILLQKCHRIDCRLWAQLETNCKRRRILFLRYSKKICPFDSSHSPLMWIYSTDFFLIPFFSFFFCCLSANSRSKGKQLEK